jgi:hypothetical protein
MGSRSSPGSRLCGSVTSTSRRSGSDVDRAYALLVVLGLVVHSPTLQAQIRGYEDEGPTSDEFKRASTRGTVVGAILAIDVIVIVFLMVTKPVLLTALSGPRPDGPRTALRAGGRRWGKQGRTAQRAEAAPPLGTPVLNYVSPRWFIVEDSAAAGT